MKERAMEERQAGDRATIGVVVPTHDRPQLLRETLRAILEQDVSAPLDIVVVFDRSEPDRTLEELSTDDRRVRVVANTRTPGLAGARNSGILAVDTDWVAFCDDDDVWAPQRLRAQLERSERDPEAVVLTTGIRVLHEGSTIDRLAGKDRIPLADLTRSRMAMLHSSTLLLRRSALLVRSGWSTRPSPGARTRTGTCSCAPPRWATWHTSTSRSSSSGGAGRRTSPAGSRRTSTPWSGCWSGIPASPGTTAERRASTASWRSARPPWDAVPRRCAGQVAPCAGAGPSPAPTSRWRWRWGACPPPGCCRCSTAGAAGCRRDGRPSAAEQRGRRMPGRPLRTSDPGAVEARRPGAEDGRRPRSLGCRQTAIRSSRSTDSGGRDDPSTSAGPTATGRPVAHISACRHSPATPAMDARHRC